MGLKQAEIFKDFLITPNATNTGITFNKKNAITINIKSDNFSNQVEIFDAACNVDFFDYKYLTFDNNAIFEITDCIQNGKYSTLFIQYLSNITFNELNNNFRVDAVSAATLQRLGLNINDFLYVLGNNAIIKNKDITETDNTTPFYYAIKLRFSDTPQNLNYYYSAFGAYIDRTQSEVELGGGNTPKGHGNLGNRICVQEYEQRDSVPTNRKDFQQFDNAVTILLPIPTRGEMTIKLPYGEIQCNISSLIETLAVLISDLTISAEITMLNNNSLFALLSTVNGKNQIKPVTISQNANAQILTIAAVDGTETPEAGDETADFGGFLQGCIPRTSDGGDHFMAHPCFTLGAQIGTPANKTNEQGFWECYNFIKFPITSINNRVLLSVTLLNSVVDISELRQDFLYIQRKNQKLRVFVDYNRNIFTEIQTSFEFAKNAYSNYEAYQKANIDLANNQAFAALEQQQQQQQTMQTFNNVETAINTTVGAAFSLGMGNYAGAASMAVGGVLSVATDNIKLAMQQQNDIANLKLAAEQAQEKARCTIVPISELVGSISIIDAFKSLIGNNGKCSLYSLRYIDLNNMQIAAIEKYVFDNYIMDKINDVTQITKPQWQTLHNYFQVKIVNRSATNTRKDFIIFAEV